MYSTYMKLHSQSCSVSEEHQLSSKLKIISETAEFVYDALQVAHRPQQTVLLSVVQNHNYSC